MEYRAKMAYAIAVLLRHLFTEKALRQWVRDSGFHSDVVDASERSPPFQEVADALVRAGYDTPELFQSLDARSRAVASSGACEELGIESAQSNITSTNLAGMLREARRKIRVIKTWFPEDDEILGGLKAALENGVSIEIICLDPKAPHLAVRSSSVGLSRGEGARRVKNMVYMTSQTLKDRRLQANCSIVLHDCWPGQPVIEIDDGTWLGFYFGGTTSPLAPWLKVDPQSALGAKVREQWLALSKKGDASSKRTVLKTQAQMLAWLKKNAPDMLSSEPSS